MVNYEIKDYVSSNGKSYFKSWFEKLGATAAAKVTSAIHKMKKGNFSKSKFLGHGVWEFKIDTGPGYRIYFCKADENIILLLAGGSKTGQNKDIQLAIRLLQEYKQAIFH